MTRFDYGVVYIAYGGEARREAEMSLSALSHYHNWPAWVIGEPIAGASLINFDRRDRGGRWAKVNLYDLSPFDYTLYLDADTRPRGDLSAIFDILRDGWDLVICPSHNQGPEAFWHIDASERQITLGEVGYLPNQLQGGVFGFSRSDPVRQFFTYWRQEWERWQANDQAALIRALHRCPLRVWLLGEAYNGGALMAHLFGKAVEAR